MLVVTLDEPPVSNLPPHSKYLSQVVYKVEQYDHEWSVYFMVVENLNALLEVLFKLYNSDVTKHIFPQYFKKSIPKDVEIVVNTPFIFKDPNGYIKLELGEEQIDLGNGWIIVPHKAPSQVS